MAEEEQEEEDENKRIRPRERALGQKKLWPSKNINEPYKNTKNLSKCFVKTLGVQK